MHFCCFKCKKSYAGYGKWWQQAGLTENTQVCLFNISNLYVSVNSKSFGGKTTMMNIDILMIDFGQILYSPYQGHKPCQLQVRKKGFGIRGFSLEGSEILDSSSDPLLKKATTISYWPKSEHIWPLGNCQGFFFFCNKLKYAIYIDRCTDITLPYPDQPNIR